MHAFPQNELMGTQGFASTLMFDFVCAPRMARQWRHYAPPQRAGYWPLVESLSLLFAIICVGRRPEKCWIPGSCFFFIRMFIESNLNPNKPAGGSGTNEFKVLIIVLVGLNDAINLADRTIFYGKCTVQVFGSAPDRFTDSVVDKIAWYAIFFVPGTITPCISLFRRGQ